MTRSQGLRFKQVAEQQPRNAEVVEMFVAGKSFGWIAEKLHLTRGVVAGIVTRARARDPGSVPGKPMGGAKQVGRNVRIKTTGLFTGLNEKKPSKNKPAKLGRELVRAPVRENVRAHVRELFPGPLDKTQEKPIEIPKINSCTILDLPANGCKFSTGQELDDPRLTYRFCGRDKGAHHAYCLSHAKLVISELRWK